MGFDVTYECVKAITTLLKKIAQGNHQVSCSYGLFYISHFLGLWKVHITTLENEIIHILFIFIILNMNFLRIQNTYD